MEALWWGVWSWIWAGGWAGRRGEGESLQGAGEFSCWVFDEVRSGNLGKCEKYLCAV